MNLVARERKRPVRSKTEDSVAAADRAPLDDSYYPLRRLSAYSGLSLRTLRKKIIDPVHPLPIFRICGKIVVRRSDYDAWALRFRVTHPPKVDAMVNELLKEL